MPDFEVEVSFSVSCAKCGKDLDNGCKTEKDRYNGKLSLEVEPCECCLANERASGVDDGRDEKDVEVDSAREESADLRDIIRTLREELNAVKTELAFWKT